VWRSIRHSGLDERFTVPHLLRGFTLVELVIVLALVSILSVAAVSRFVSMSALNNQVFYDDLMTSVRYAQKFAIGTGCHTQVNLTNTTLTLTQRTNCTAGAFTVAVVDPGNRSASSFTRVAPTGITIITGGGVWPIYFNGLGQASQVSNSAVNTFTVTVGTRTFTIVGETGFTQ